MSERAGSAGPMVSDYTKVKAREHTARDGNREFSVGFWFLIPVPRQKKVSREDPHELLGLVWIL